MSAALPPGLEPPRRAGPTKVGEIVCGEPRVAIVRAGRLKVWQSLDRPALVYPAHDAGTGLFASASRFPCSNSMRFSLIDRVDEFNPGRQIAARKNLTMAEEYLADHFPGFPVMPGVLMLEAMTQASAWLIRASEDFLHSIVTLKEARNVKYGNFVEPGQTLLVTAEILKQDEHTTTLKSQGTVDGNTTVSARLVLERYNLADVEPSRAEADDVVRHQLREQWAQLCRHLSPAPS